MTQPVTIYTLRGCPYCVRARRLLDRREIPYREVPGDGDPGFRAFLQTRTGGSTVPQIVIGEDPVGGSAELAALDRRGILTVLVDGGSFPVAGVRRRLSWRALPMSLVALFGGGACGPWRHAVELRDRTGRVVERHEVASAGDARALAERLNER